MRKTRKEKLRAVLRRQKEFERIKLSQELPKSPAEQVVKKQEVNQFLSTDRERFVSDKTVENLTNFSHLPKQIIKIGLTTGILVVIQFILSFLIL